MYGPHTNEQLVGKAIKGKREQVFLATKFGIVRDPADPQARGVCSRPDYIRRAVEGSLQRLGWRRSIFTTNTGWILRCRSKKWSARWRI